MFNNKNKLRSQQGFSLVEIMISLLVFLVIMLGVAGGLVQVLRANNATVMRDEALRLAEDHLNQLKNEQFTINGTSALLAPAAWTAPPVTMTVTIRAGVTTTFLRSTQIVDLATSAAALKRIDVVVGWNNPGNAGPVMAPTGANHQTTLSTIIVQSDL